MRSCRTLCALALVMFGCGDNLSPRGGQLLVSPEIGLRTNEAGAAASFTVQLTDAPLDDVAVALTSMDTNEGTVSPATMMFTAADFDVPQNVKVQGVDDDVADGNKAYVVRVDAEHVGTVDLSLVNDDDDTAGFVVTPEFGLETSEAGTQAQFSVGLLSKPSADVTIPVQSSDSTEGVASVSSLVFTPANYKTPQPVLVTGVADALADGDVFYAIVLSPATSGDTTYNHLDPDDVALENLDLSVQGVTVTPGSGLATTEAGTTATFTVVLDSQPTADVTFGLSSNDTTEATVSAAQLVFTSQNWNTPQTVTVTGVNDFVADGPQPFTIVLDAAISTDQSFAGVDPLDPTGTNSDNDAVGINIAAVATPLRTSESGASDSFNVTLNSQPTADVMIPLSSSDATEGSVSPPVLVFTAADWNQPQTVTVTGLDDAIADGDIAYSVVLGAATSGDPLYTGIDAPDVSAVNVDNDIAGFTLDTDTVTVSEFQDADFFTVVLNTAPTANVTIAVTSSDTTEGTVAPATLTFTPQNWNTPQTVTVTGVNDAIADGNQNFTIVLAPAVSADPAYALLDPPDVAALNIDNDTAQVFVKARKRLKVSENGQSATFRVRLTLAPTAPVTCTLQSSDTTEATINTGTLTFTPGQFGFQTVTVTGVNDPIVDGNQPFTILTFPCTSADPAYNGSNPLDVHGINRDND